MTTINPAWTQQDRINIAILRLAVANIGITAEPAGLGAIDVTVTASSHPEGVTGTAVADVFTDLGMPSVVINHRAARIAGKEA